MSKSEASSRTNRAMRLVPAGVLFGMVLALGACGGPEPMQTTTTQRTTTIQQPAPPPITTTTTRTQQYTP
jgi:hypothetical protein